VNLLLDTHALLWWLPDSPRLGSRARRAIAAADIVYVSAATAWEIGIKKSRGKLRFDGNLEEQLSRDRVRPLSITLLHAWTGGQLPWGHSDPFDRMLVAQAMVESVTLVTTDKAIQSFSVPVIPV
jgi:PIN domain nuclease of toxin-antitoxin system